MEVDSAASDYWAEYRDAMNGGQYFEAHEILETPWRANRRIHLQIAIWIAAGFVHWSRLEFRGAHLLFNRIIFHPDAQTLPMQAALHQWVQAIESQQPLVTMSDGDLDALVSWGQQQDLKAE